MENLATLHSSVERFDQYTLAWSLLWRGLLKHESPASARSSPPSKLWPPLSPLGMLSNRATLPHFPLYLNSWKPTKSRRVYLFTILPSLLSTGCPSSSLMNPGRGCSGSGRGGKATRWGHRPQQVKWEEKNSCSSIFYRATNSSTCRMLFIVSSQRVA